MDHSDAHTVSEAMHVDCSLVDVSTARFESDVC